MQNFNILKSNNPIKTYRVANIIGTFDLQQDNFTETFTGKIDLSNKWQIGLIVGNSGTGKTTIAKELFNQEYITQFEYGNNAVIDDMPQDKNVNEIIAAFNSVGFSSPPSWIKPYNTLSNGQKMRVDLANALLSNKEIICFDEFTSVVDRQVAKISSFAIQKGIRRSNKQFIAVTCHFDVVDWLMPDWIFNTNDMTFQNLENQKKNRPPLNIKIFKYADKSIWRMFAKHHYLSHSFNKAAHAYIITVDDMLAGFTSVLPFPHPYLKNAVREHRTVILPDFQGIGLSKILRNFVANLHTKNGKLYTITTTTPALIHTMSNDNHWKCYRQSRIIPEKKSENWKAHFKRSSNRITTAWKYIP